MTTVSFNVVQPVSFCMYLEAVAVVIAVADVETHSKTVVNVVLAVAI